MTSTLPSRVLSRQLAEASNSTSSLLSMSLGFDVRIGDGKEVNQVYTSVIVFGGNVWPSKSAFQI